MRRTQVSSIALGLLALAACKGKPTTTQPVIKPVEPPPEAQVAPAAAPIEQPASPENLSGVDLTRAAVYNSQQALVPVYFETDSAEIPASEIAKLDANYAWLNDHPHFNLLVEGNCDERNTEEYNLALGQQRADKVKAYLLGKGLPAARIKTISYGETQPAIEGHDESAWQKNRRAQFKLLDR